LVVDEGHRLKNKSSQLNTILSTFSAASRLLLTGTPLQNNLQVQWSVQALPLGAWTDHQITACTRCLQELYTLLNFVEPEEFEFDQKRDRLGVEEMRKEIEELKPKLKQHMLRRLKKDVFKVWAPGGWSRCCCAAALCHGS
jgi:chromodomain-helicase-DNA-binding protein 1